MWNEKSFAGDTAYYTESYFRPFHMWNLRVYHMRNILCHMRYQILHADYLKIYDSDVSHA